MPRVYQENTLGAVVVFSIGGTTLWSGRAKLRPEDLGDLAEELPPAAVASLGTKRLFPQDKLLALTQIKNQMKRVLTDYGTRFTSSGFAIAEEDAPIVSTLLDDLVTQGEACKEALMAGFDASIKAWWQENPAWRNILAAGTPEKERVRARIHFDWEAYAISAVKDPKLGERLMQRVKGLGRQLYLEITKEAQAFVRKSLTSIRSEADQRTLGPLRRLVEKLDRQSLLDHLAYPIAEICNLAISSFPSKGKIAGDDYIRLVRLATFMSDEQRMRTLGDRIYKNELTVAKACEEVVGSLKVPEKTPETKRGKPAAPQQQQLVAKASWDAASLFDFEEEEDGTNAPSDLPPPALPGGSPATSGPVFINF